MVENTESKRRVSNSEIFWIALCSLIGLGGIAMIVLGFVADYLPVLNSENYSGQTAFETAMHMPYRWFGVILLLGSAFISVITLNFYAKKTDIDEERAVRRAQRLQVISDSPEISKEVKPEATEVNSTSKNPAKLS
jgi:predicted RNA-binding protein with PUA-like domain